MAVKPWPPELRRVTVPPAVSGLWSVERCDAYTQLCYSNRVVMTDVPFELETHREPVIEAKRRAPHGGPGGIDVLINGLGLGLIVQAMLSIRGVRRITVVEKSSDVILLVAPHYMREHGSRLEVHLADAYSWQPPAGTRYGVVWHDVWPAMHADNQAGMRLLEGRYGGLCDWQGSWPCQRPNKMY